MARIIKHDQTGPIEVPASEKPQYVCACGLTANAPFCDGSHKPTRSEEPGKCYVYRDGQPVEIDDPTA